jgi:hypothetical protein
LAMKGKAKGSEEVMEKKGGERTEVIISKAT